MSELRTITRVTREVGISTRTLRYYEQIGLLESRRVDGYSYRVYDETAVRRLGHIIILRKLRIPLRQISTLLSDESVTAAVEIFNDSIRGLDEEISSLSVIRGILSRLIDTLNSRAVVSLESTLMSDAALLAMVEPLTPSKKLELERADTMLRKLTDRDVRIVYLPPSDVAAYQFEGDEPEDVVSKVIDDFVRNSNLIAIKPDVRHYGFNAPNPKDETGAHGYEMWVTIPEGFDVPAPLVKKHFKGGMYAAHMIPMGAFEEWESLFGWVHSNEKYDYNGCGSPENMFDALEECLNFPHAFAKGQGFPQLDLLIPIKEK